MEIRFNTTTYPHAIAFEILLANPDESKKMSLINYLSSKSDPMPQEMIDILQLMLNPNTTRTEMQKQLALKTSTYNNSYNEALFAMMDYQDSSYTAEDYMMVYNKIGSLNSEYMIVEHLLDERKIVDAENRLNGISQMVRLDAKELIDFQIFSQWVSLRIAMINGGRDWSSLIESDITELRRMSNYFDTYASITCFHILNEQMDQNNFVPPAFGNNNTLRSKVFSTTEISQFVDVFPNPANYILNIQLKETILTSVVCELVISNMLGVEIQRIKINPDLKKYALNTKGWPSGMYVYQIISPNNQKELHGRFEIQH